MFKKPYSVEVRNEEEYWKVLEVLSKYMKYVWRGSRKHLLAGDNYKKRIKYITVYENNGVLRGSFMEDNETLVTFEEFLNAFEYFEQSVVLPKINKVIRNEDATIILFEDGSKSVVKKEPLAKDDQYTAFCCAITKRIFGSTTKAMEFMYEVLENNNPSEWENALEWLKDYLLLYGVNNG